MSGAEQTLAVDEIASAPTLGATPSSSASSTAELTIDRGTLISRYVVLGKVGAGAMGVVFAAHDPELDRKIAIKLLKWSGSDQDGARTRLQREAQALAKLGHPNVVGVYDVGTHAKQLFLAMEFIEGQTLGAWMKASETPHPWPAVVRLLADAGRGLAAAHEAGLVHRDFKPDNVMIGKDGRVRVMDFGLARADAERDVGIQSSQQPPHTDKQMLLETVTRTGTLIGSPAYMALEVFEGRPADARSDQFSFCVALYEGLYGERPFEGKQMAALIGAVMNEEIRPAPRHSTVPAWLRSIVVRGLAADPARRWPSMQALLDALATVPMKRRRKRWAAVAFVGVLGSALALTLIDDDEPQLAPARDCSEQSERVHEVWNASVSEQLAQTFAARGKLAQDSWPFVEAEIERWTSNWTAIDGELCQRYGQDAAPELHERQLVCLDRALDRFGLAIAMLSSASAEEMERSFDLLGRLPDPATCRDPSAPNERLAGDPQELAEFEREIDRVEFEHALGRLQKADEASAKLFTATKSLGYEHAHVRLAELRSLLLSELDRRDEAVDVAFSGLAAAEREGSAALRLRVFIHLVQLHIDMQDLAGAERWLEPAKILAAEHETDRELQRDLSYCEGWVAAIGGRIDVGLAAFDRALALTDPETDPLGHAELVVSRAQLLGYVDKAREAIEQFTVGEREYMRLLGPEHPEVLNLRLGKGYILMDLDREEARKVLLDAAATLDTLRGGPTSATLAARARAAWLLGALGDCAGALAEYDPLIGPAREQMQYPSPDLGELLTRRAELCNYTTPEAVAFFREALALYREAVGDQHIMVAATRAQLSRALYESGALEPAREEVETALSIYAAAAPMGAEMLPETRAIQMLIRHAQGEAGALDGIDELLASLPKGYEFVERLEALRQ